MRIHRHIHVLNKADIKKTLSADVPETPCVCLVSLSTSDGPAVASLQPKPLLGEEVGLVPLISVVKQILQMGNSLLDKSLTLINERPAEISLDRAIQLHMGKRTACAQQSASFMTALLGLQSWSKWGALGLQPHTRRSSTSG